MKGVLVVIGLLLVSLMAVLWIRSGSTSEPGVVGVYLEDVSAPPGATMRLEVHRDGRWVMANMLTGYWGTWKKTGAGYTFICDEGPAGHIAKPDVFQVRLVGQDYLIQSFGKNSLKFERLPDRERFLLPITP